ncbi:hypothetical protein ABC365_00550 [Brevundimonas sp. 3P9-tot-E]|jgi:hypothetical protein|uniref:hypothetical protein n=1 Tax=Brevundimonas TaxID=41275 RepID=UPI0019076456|nr:MULTISPECIES: hypothetical protein [Brevundimonas]MBK1970116.1 hypothetical protein [Brevundimonas diminuta]MDA0743165.1 hypothetical protein [Pseudomonadota bacterium]MDA1320757.1 hypothetical protein [Pseudomonadota bacterium]MDM8354207.1 hypothetical protein [Brevundimonas diminuta]
MPEHARPLLMTDTEVEALRLQLLEVIPRLERRHLLELADTLHDAARERRWSDDRLDLRI